MIQRHEITIKDYQGKIEYDHQLGLSYSDINYEYGKIEMTGTEQELTDYLAVLRKNSPSMNLIGVKSREL